MNHVSTEALNIERKIHPGMGMFVRLLLIIVLPVFGNHFLLNWGIRRATVVLPINERLLLLFFHWILTCTDSRVIVILESSNEWL
jgi:hypothetical protein